MKNIINKILQHDKLKHFFIGSIVAFILTAFKLDALLIAFLCVGLGILKETFDYFGGKQEYLDVLYTGATGIILFLLTL